jgi:hypothetical protein
MVTDPRHLRVDETRRSMTASMIFKWYTGDFVAPSQARVGGGAAAGRAGRHLFRCRFVAADWW